MLSRAHRLTHKSDIERVFAAGRAAHHPLVSLRAAPNQLPVTRVAFVAGKRIGGAVVRNQVRRRLRHQMRSLLPSIPPGWDILVLSRPQAAGATSAELLQGLKEVLERRGLLAGAKEE